MPFTNLWDETQPPDTQTANLLGQDIRTLKADIRERLKYISGHIADRPTPDVSWSSATAGMIFFSIDEKKVYQWVGIPPAWVDVTGSIVSTTPMAGLSANRPVSGDFVGQVYFAFDTGKLWYWDGAAWSDITSEMGLSSQLVTVSQGVSSGFQIGEWSINIGGLIIKFASLAYTGTAIAGSLSATQVQHWAFSSPFPHNYFVAFASSNNYFLVSNIANMGLAGLDIRCQNVSSSPTISPVIIFVVAIGN